MHGGCLAQVQQLGQPLRVVAVILVLGAEDQPELAGVGHHDSCGQRPQDVVVVSVAAAGLVADLEAVGQGLQDPQDLVQAAHLAALDELPSSLSTQKAIRFV